MDSDLERLKTWMAENGFDAQSLIETMREPRPGTVLNMLNGKNPISQPFKFRFWHQFGHKALAEVFGINAENFSKVLSERDWFPDRYAAHRALTEAIKQGVMQPANTYKCHGCDKQAQHYHHESYAPKDHLAVVPLCRKCHQQHHGGRRRLTFGVVPTSVGVIRIAIAGHTTQ